MLHIQHKLEIGKEFLLLWRLKYRFRRQIYQNIYIYNGTLLFSPQKRRHLLWVHPFATWRDLEGTVLGATSQVQEARLHPFSLKHGTGKVKLTSRAQNSGLQRLRVVEDSVKGC